MAVFAYYIGIDYLGAKTPSSCLKNRREYWNRRGVAEWLVEQISEDRPTLVGIDHGFSFPLRYFEAHGLKPNWPAFRCHWPTDEDIYVNSSMETIDLVTRRQREIGLPFSSAEFGGEIHPYWDSWLRLIRQRLGEHPISGPSMAGRFPADRVKMTEAVSIAMTLLAMERRAL